MSWLQMSDAIKLLVAVVGLLLLFVLVRIAHRALTRHVEDPAIRYHGRKIVTFAGYFLAVLLVAVIFRTRLQGLTIFLGFIGAGIAFALQEVITSVAGWIALSFGGFYRVGDRVQLGEIKGDVIDISLLRTTLMEIGEWVQADLYTGRIVRIANSFVFRSPTYNFSGEFPFIWDEWRIPIMYGSDLDETRRLLQAIAEEETAEVCERARDAWIAMRRRYRLEEARLEPMVTLRATDNWVEFTLRYLVDPRRRRFMQDLLFTRFLAAIARTEGRVRTASTTIQIVGMPHLTIETRARD